MKPPARAHQPSGHLTAHPNKFEPTKLVAFRQGHVIGGLEPYRTHFRVSIMGPTKPPYVATYHQAVMA